jgi:hypothetical protein
MSTKETYKAELENMTASRLADEIDRCNKVRDAAYENVIRHETDWTHRLSETLAMLGSDHIDVIAYYKACSAVENVWYEARSRCGPATFNSLYATMLRNMPRRRRKAA